MACYGTLWPGTRCGVILHCQHPGTIQANSTTLIRLQLAEPGSDTFACNISVFALARMLVLMLPITSSACPALRHTASGTSAVLAAVASILVTGRMSASQLL